MYAELVQAVLTMFPDIAELNDAQALLLLAATMLSIVDSLQQRAEVVCDALVNADSDSPDWTQDPDELVLRMCQRAATWTRDGPMYCVGT